jgi:uncharacterized Zn-binding protein involved in type VI secretion
MPSQFVARVGDPGSHGGTITTGSLKVKSDGIFIARHGDNFACAEHGNQPLISNAKTLADGLPIVRVGDQAACGSVITSGSLKTKAD